jgi:hypothetical protein
MRIGRLQGYVLAALLEDPKKTRLQLRNEYYENCGPSRNKRQQANRRTTFYLSLRKMRKHGWIGGEWLDFDVPRWKRGGIAPILTRKGKELAANILNELQLGRVTVGRTFIYLENESEPVEKWED